jgi:hypothetical protein
MAHGTWKTTGGGGSGGGLVLIVVIAALALGSGAASAIASAVEVILITTAIVVGLAVAGVVGLLVYRARSDRPGRPVAAPVVYELPPEVRPQLEESHISAAPEIRNGASDLGPELCHGVAQLRAIEPPREIHLHLNVSPDQLAAIMRHYTEEK